MRLTAQDGVIGYGDATPIPWFGTETPDDAESFCRRLGALVDDEALDNVPGHFSALPGAFDAARKELARSTRSARTHADQLESQGKSSSDVPAYLQVAALLPAGKACLEKIDALAEAGFRTFKWKVGVLDASDEIGILDDLISRMPTGGKLRLDANGAWDRRKAERWLERCAERPIEFVEQPIARDERNVQDLILGLANNYPTTLALDESIATGREVDAWLDLGWPGIFVVKPQLLGRAEATLEKFRKKKSAVVFSSALETAIGAKAALRLAFEFGATERALGFGIWPLFEDSRLDGPRLAPFIRREDLDTLRPDEVWNALS